MITKLERSVKYGKQHGGFGIEILYPGITNSETNDTGLATVGRIDQAQVTPGTLIPMHPHQDDEILTYLRAGKVKHLDSEGTTAEISNRKLMLMNAGARFYHEELVLDQGGILQGLQIFIRPEAGGMTPKVQFHDLDDAFSSNQWRKIAGVGDDYPLEIRSRTWIQDIRMEKGSVHSLPEFPEQDLVLLFYVFQGKVSVNDDTLLDTGESIIIEQESPAFKSLETSDVVLFVTDRNAPYFEGGMYSGNKKD